MLVLIPSYFWCGFFINNKHISVVLFFCKNVENVYQILEINFITLHPPPQSVKKYKMLSKAYKNHFSILLQPIQLQNIYALYKRFCLCFLCKIQTLPCQECKYEDSEDPKKSNKEQESKMEKTKDKCFHMQWILKVC